MAGKRSSRVRLAFSDPESTYIQSSYPIHPVCLDGCLESGVPSLWQGHRSSIDTALVPAIIDDLVIRSRSTKSEYVIAVSTSEFKGTGNPEEAKSYKTHVSAYDEDSGLQIIQMSGLSYNELDTVVHRNGTHTYSQLKWIPDFSFLTQKQLLTFVSPQQENTMTRHGFSSIRMSHFISMAAHKKPNLAVLEVDMTGESHSTWLDPSKKDDACRVAYRRYVYTSNSLTRLEEAREKYQERALVEFDICNITRPNHEFNFRDAFFDLVLIKLVSASRRSRAQCLLRSNNSLIPPKVACDTP